jgi:hypothetical protein
VELQYLPRSHAPEYQTIEFYNYAPTKTNFIVFVGKDGHVEMVCMYQSFHGSVEFTYIGSDAEFYEYLQQVSDRITEADIVE